MQSNVLVCFIITNLVAITPIAKAVPKSPDSLPLSVNLFQVPVDDSSQELIFSSNGNPEAAPNSDPLQMSSLDPQASAMNNAAFDDDFLTLGTTSDDLFASSCDNKILRRGNKPSSCDASNNQAPSPDVDLLQRLGQGDLLLKLLATPPGSQEGSELLEDEDQTQKLPGPYDIGCDPNFPFRLCCNGPPTEDNRPTRFSWGVPPFIIVQSCFRCVYFALSLRGCTSFFEHSVYFLSQRFSVDPFDESI